MNIIITASGGPFYKKKFSTLKNIKFNQAIKHPKWKMGYKNSIDLLVNNDVKYGKWEDVAMYCVETPDLYN